MPPAALLWPGTLGIFPLHLRTQRRFGYCVTARTRLSSARQASKRISPSHSDGSIRGASASERISPSHSLWWLDSRPAERARESLLLVHSYGSTRPMRLRLLMFFLVWIWVAGANARSVSRTCAHLSIVYVTYTVDKCAHMSKTACSSWLIFVDRSYI